MNANGTWKPFRGLLQEAGACVVRQFKKPSGFFGNITGYIMAKRPSNILRNHWMLELAQLEPGQQVLEIGYGPGIALETALKKMDSGMIVGIDHSDTMRQVAARRVAAAIDQGRAKLLLGDIESCPELGMKFDHIYSANVVMFLQDPVTVFRHLKSLLKPNGDILTLYMPRGAHADSHRFGDMIRQWKQEAGFADIRVENRDFDGLTAVCVIARVFEGA